MSEVRFIATKLERELYLEGKPDKRIIGLGVHDLTLGVIC